MLTLAVSGNVFDSLCSALHWRKKKKGRRKHKRWSAIGSPRTTVSDSHNTVKNRKTQGNSISSHTLLITASASKTWVTEGVRHEINFFLPLQTPWKRKEEKEIWRLFHLVSLVLAIKKRMKETEDQFLGNERLPRTLKRKEKKRIVGPWLSSNGRPCQTNLNKDRKKRTEAEISSQGLGR